MNRRFLTFGCRLRSIPEARVVAFLAVLLPLLSITAGSVQAHDKRQGDLHIGHPWARPAVADGPAEVYFAIVNRGSRADRLVGADTALAARASLAETVGAAVEPRTAIEVPPGRPVPLRPGRLHVRLEDLKQPLRAGDEFPVTLRFALSPPIEVTVQVETAPGH
jgi:periplasmic copper chaperone A